MGNFLPVALPALTGLGGTDRFPAARIKRVEAAEASSPQELTQALNAITATLVADGENAWDGALAAAGAGKKSMLMWLVCDDGGVPPIPPVPAILSDVATGGTGSIEVQRNYYKALSAFVGPGFGFLAVHAADGTKGDALTVAVLAGGVLPP